MEGGTSMVKKKRAWPKDVFTDLIFSWSIEDIFNESLYENQVEKIEESFDSVDHYLSSFDYPLREETRADIAASLEVIDKAPFAELISFDEKPHGPLVFDIKVDYWRNIYSDGKESYKTLPGDIVIISDVKLETRSDLQRLELNWTFASVKSISDDENGDSNTLTNFRVSAARDIRISEELQQSFYVVFLVNAIPSKRIWNALGMRKNLDIIQKVLCTGHEIQCEDKCEFCSAASIDDGSTGDNVDSLLSTLNNSQATAILTSLKKLKCHHQPSLQLIWGPPGTGKTKTVSIMLFILWKMKYRTLTCAPTNVAITQVASRLVGLVKESFAKVNLVCPFGDILLVGNKDRLKVDQEIEEVYLDYRVDRLVECLGPLTGWKHCVSSMSGFLEDCVSQYDIYVDNENKLADKEEAHKERVEISSLISFARSRFKSIASPLRVCLLIFCTHLPLSFIKEENFERLVLLISMLDCLEGRLFQENVGSKEVEEVFSREPKVEVCESSLVEELPLRCLRDKCLHLLKLVSQSLGKLSLPSAMSKETIRKFCIQMSSLVLCTSCTSYKLHSLDMEPFNLLVIDEAAQLKECESVIPLQLKGLKHAVLVGDECQLPAIIKSRVSQEAGLGRSLFERLSALGHFKHLLNMQYRMHPSISHFPNSKFYCNQIHDAPNVKHKMYEKRFLPGKSFGPYSFINVPLGKEELDDVGHSRINMVEVALVLKIVHNLFKAWSGSTKTLSIGVISPYAAQVLVILGKLRRKYDNHEGFEVKVKSVDGFQGGEEDIIIISTVRSNRCGSIGFLSSLQRTNVALTRARHCLWILGNEQTLLESHSVWEALILDAKKHQCFFHAADVSDLQAAMLDVKKEYDQLDDLLNADSFLFKSLRWKVLFSDNFRKSFQKLASSRLRKSAINLLVKLASGWRPKKRNAESFSPALTDFVKKFKVEGQYVICTVDIQKDHTYAQVLRIWDILPLEEVEKLLRRLDSICSMYTDEYISLCKEKCLEGDLEVPKNWKLCHDVIQFKSVTESKLNHESIGAVNGRSYVESSRVSESLLLMKFYSLSSGTVSHLLSDHHGGELDLPFEVTNEEREIIQFSRSSFILGRSGTGKTTVLTMKLLQKEQQYHSAVDGMNAVSQNPEESVESSCVREANRATLRQLFVTVSPKLCYAVKQQISQLISFACGGTAESSLLEIDDLDGTTQFRDIPNSLIGIPYTKYPLVITFHKFLLMLDGTIGSSYFDRFSLTWDLSTDRSLRSVALQAFIREKEVNYDRFCSLYWPHFNAQLTKNLDSSRVFTEIFSYIKGGLKAGDFHDGKLSRESYISMSDHRISTISAETREGIYSIFLDYEKMKIERCEYDLADLVNDLHLRLKRQHLDGDKVDFVYIDEVQDLTMRQIALFKYICRNVDEGYVFSGDTAQTIARGLDFRFEDIRNLFYTEFVMDSKGGETVRRSDKGHLSRVFQLVQNFRTHAGVLKLAQSVIDLLCHYFPQSVDFLKPETSLIYGEAPVLLKPGADENAIITIFGSSATVGGKVFGFGAEQVILVRDEFAKKEVSSCVGKQALILTIVECKGLEFQDVLLYNFFGSSPLGKQWRVVYEFMKKHGLLDMSCPSFCEARHNILCSELKQLYVAVTRTRQRLWICESNEEFSRPIFDYWRELCLVETREIDASLAQAMQTSSTPEEWKSRGVKLFWERNYEMAIMCFEKAGEKNWEKRTKAAGLRAAAERIRGSNPEEACTYLREAAEIFDSIGRFESAAECFYDLREYERAGKIYLEKCGELIKAAECFTQAGCYEQAASVYAKGNYFSECLSVCTKGNFFDLGLEYVAYWKQHAVKACTVAKEADEFDKIEKNFLKNCAFHYFELNDRATMMKFVKAFPSVDMKREFLKSLECLDELLLLEETLGNFAEAAELARLEGNVLHEADLIEKAGDFEKASSLILLHVLSKSLWMAESKGWPPKSFPQKVELLEKVISLAQRGSNFEAMHAVVKVLCSESSDLFALKHMFVVSQKYKCLIGQVLCCRKILDVHFESNTARYVWQDKVSINVQSLEELVSCSQVSISTLLWFWNSWKQHIFDIVESLDSLNVEEFGENSSFCNFCLNYFGARQQLNDLNVTYVLLHPAAEWVKKINPSFIRRSKKRVIIDSPDFIHAARLHWHTELLLVGLKVLETLDSLYKSPATSRSLFQQSMCLLNMYEVSKLLVESKEVDSKNFEWRIPNFSKLSVGFFEKVFPLDPRQSVVENMISLRRTDLSSDLLQEFIIQDISNTKGFLSYGQIGRALMVWLASRKPSDDLYEKIVGRIHTEPWKSFMKILSCMKPKEGIDESQSGYAIANHEFTLVQRFSDALQDTFNANWRVYDYMSPGCLLYLVERFLILVSQCQGFFFTTKSSLLEWLISEHSEAVRTSRPAISPQSLDFFYHSIVVMVKQFIFDKIGTVEWIRRSNLRFDVYYKLLVLRLVVILCLLCVNSGKYYDVLFSVLCNTDVRNQLPRYFYNILRQGMKGKPLQISEIGEAFEKAGDPLLLVSRSEKAAEKYSNVISVQLGADCNREDIIGLLFPSGTSGSHAPNSTVPTSLEMPFSELRQQRNWAVFEVMSVYLKLIGSENGGSSADVSSVALKVKEEVASSIRFLTAATAIAEEQKPSTSLDFITEVKSMLQELKQLHSLFENSNSETASMEILLKSLLSRKPLLEIFLNQFVQTKVNSDNVIPPEEHPEEKGDAMCVSVEKKEIQPVTTKSESSNQAEKKQVKGKGKNNKQKKGKSKKK